MHSLYSIISLLILLLACSGCSDSLVEAKLNQAEAVIQEKPAEALAVLKSIDVSQLHSSSLEARYALLYSKARYKNYDDAPNDSLISIAVDYYEKNGEEDEKFYAYLYQGIIRSALGNKKQASHSLFRALYNSESVDDHYSMGQLYMYLSALYSGLNNIEALRYSRLAAKEYDAAGLTLYYLNAKTNEATARLRLFDFEGTEALIDSIHSLAFELNDTIAICDIMSLEAKYAMARDSFELATQIYRKLQNDYAYELSAQDMGYLSLLHINRSQESAQEWMNASHQSLVTLKDSLEYYTNMSIYFRTLQDDTNAICYKDSVLALFEKLYLNEQQHAEYAERCDYLELKEQQEAYRNRMTIGYLAAGLCIFVLVIFLLASILKKNKVLAEMQREMIKNLELELAFHSKERTDALSILKSEVFAKFLNLRLEEKTGLSHDEQRYIHHQFINHLPEFHSALERIVKLSETELMVCYLIKLGLSPNEIAMLCNKTAQAISQIRSRLYTKAFRKKGKPSDWDTFINSI